MVLQLKYSKSFTKNKYTQKKRTEKYTPKSSEKEKTGTYVNELSIFRYTNAFPNLILTYWIFCCSEYYKLYGSLLEVHH